MGMQGGYGIPNALHSNVPSKVAANCPPYWMLFSSPQQSRLASRWSSDFWEPNPRRRSRSLNAAHFHAMNDPVKFTISNSDDDDSSDNEEASVTRPKSTNSGLRRQVLDVKDLHSRCSSHLLNLPSCCGLSSEQCSSTLRCSLPNSDAQRQNLWKIQNHGDSFHELSASQQLFTHGHTRPIMQVRKMLLQVSFKWC